MPLGSATAGSFVFSGRGALYFHCQIELPSEFVINRSPLSAMARSLKKFLLFSVALGNIVFHLPLTVLVLVEPLF
jgi:hypothetical protein